MPKKELKVKRIIENFDFVGIIKIYDGEDSDEAYFGDALNCPWYLMNMVVDTTVNGEGMFVSIDKESGDPYLGIYVREAKTT